MSQNYKYRLTPLIKELPAIVPFVGPETAERDIGAPFFARMGANENVFGPSPKAKEVMRQAADDIWKYADPESHDLRTALAEFYGVGLENVMVGEGVDGLLGYTARMFCSPDAKVVTTQGSYPTFNFHVVGYGSTLHYAQFKDDREDPEALVEMAREVDATLLYFSNPNNPMGTCWPSETVESLIENVPAEAVLILDEAYIETAPENTAPPIDVSIPNVLRFRTFSKAYGMAGARVGYVIGHAGLIAQYDKIRNHFGMNRAAQMGALAALDDQDYLHETINKIKNARERIYTIAADNNLSAIPSATNFVAVDCGRDTAFAKSVLDGLVARRVFVRMPGSEPQSRCIRVSVGNDENLDLFARELKVVLSDLR